MESDGCGFTGCYCQADGCGCKASPKSHCAQHSNGCHVTCGM